MEGHLEYFRQEDNIRRTLKEDIMFKRKGSLLMCCMVAVTVLAWGGGGVLAQSPSTNGSGKGQQSQPTLKDAQKAAAAYKRKNGKMEYTTNDDRWAAAQRTADRQAAAIAASKGKGAGK